MRKYGWGSSSVTCCEGTTGEATGVWGPRHSKPLGSFYAALGGSAATSAAFGVGLPSSDACGSATASASLPSTFKPAAGWRPTPLSSTLGPPSRTLGDSGGAFSASLFSGRAAADVGLVAGADGAASGGAVGPASGAAALLRGCGVGGGGLGVLGTAAEGGDGGRGGKAASRVYAWLGVTFGAYGAGWRYCRLPTSAPSATGDGVLARGKGLRAMTPLERGTGSGDDVSCGTCADYTWSGSRSGEGGLLLGGWASGVTASAA